jgi:pentapeptide MXKDX repeat protein
VTTAELRGVAGNKAGCGIVIGKRQMSHSRNTLNPKDDHPMTTTTRIGLGLSAALVSLGLAFAPAVFAQDKMGKDDGMKKESMSKDAMKKDDGMMKKDGMKHDGMMKDGMKKDDGMKKN